MGVLDRLFGRKFWRGQGVFARLFADPEDKRRHLPPVIPTAGTRKFEMPRPTPTTRPLAAPGATAGTRTYGGQGGTPSIRRIHNPTRPGR
jgi:hypothetical protein